MVRTRLNKAFSKKLSNLKAAVALHFAHYKFVRIHPNLRVTPAMAAGVSDRLWFIEQLIDIRNRWERCGVKEIRVLHREGHRTALDVTNCVGCLERSGISAHSRKEQPGYGTVMVNEDSDKDRALQILRAQGFEVVDV